MKNRTGDTDPKSASASTSHLLDDEAVQRFIVDGYITLRPALPDAYHSALRRQLDALIALEGNPGNDLLPKVPELSALFADPVVDGAPRHHTRLLSGAQPVEGRFLRRHARRERRKAALLRGRGRLQGLLRCLDPLA